LAQIASQIGKADDAAAYAALAAEIRNRFNAAFYDSSSGNIADGSQTALACALYQGLTPEKHVDRVLALLIKKLQTSDLNFDCGILGTKYLFNALTTLGKPELAYDRINSSAYPGWGFWLEKGATTLWESWDGSASRIHIMYGDVSAWFYKTLAGLRPDENQAGFKHFIVKPYFAPDLSWIKTHFDSPYGIISIAWEQQNDRRTLKVQVPVNTSASVYWPSTGHAVIITDDQGVVIETPDIGMIQNEYLIFNLGSGNYQISSADSSH
jgi:alpha-L-rhamnosidase